MGALIRENEQLKKAEVITRSVSDYEVPTNGVNQRGNASSSCPPSTAHFSRSVRDDSGIQGSADDLQLHDR